MKEWRPQLWFSDINVVSSDYFSISWRLETTGKSLFFHAPVNCEILGYLPFHERFKKFFFKFIYLLWFHRKIIFGQAQIDFTGCFFDSTSSILHLYISITLHIFKRTYHFSKMSCFSSCTEPEISSSVALLYQTFTVVFLSIFCRLFIYNSGTFYS